MKRVNTKKLALLTIKISLDFIGAIFLHKKPEFDTSDVRAPQKNIYENFCLNFFVFVMFESDMILYSKTCVKRPLINRQTKILMTNGSLMKVKSIAECSCWSILQYF